MLIWGLLLGIIAIVFAIFASKKTIDRDAEKIVKTKLVSTNPHSTGRRDGRFYTETTFMLYMKDGSHKAVTVKNDTMEYKSYMSKLEA